MQSQNMNPYNNQQPTFTVLPQPSHPSLSDFPSHLTLGTEELGSIDVDLLQLLDNHNPLLFQQPELLAQQDLNSNIAALKEPLSERACDSPSDLSLDQLIIQSRSVSPHEDAEVKQMPRHTLTNADNYLKQITKTTASPVIRRSRSAITVRPKSPTPGSSLGKHRKVPRSNTPVRKGSHVKRSKTPTATTPVSPRNNRAVSPNPRKPNNWTRWSSWKGKRNSWSSWSSWTVSDFKDQETRKQRAAGGSQILPGASGSGIRPPGGTPNPQSTVNISSAREKIPSSPLSPTSPHSPRQPHSTPHTSTWNIVQQLPQLSRRGGSTSATPPSTSTPTSPHSYMHPVELSSKVAEAFAGPGGGSHSPSPSSPAQNSSYSTFLTRPTPVRSVSTAYPAHAKSAPPIQWVNESSKHFGN